MKKTTVSTISRKALAVFMSVVLAVGLMPLPAYADLIPGEIDLTTQGESSSEGTSDLPGGESASLTTMAKPDDTVTVDDVAYGYTWAFDSDSQVVATITKITTKKSTVVIPTTLDIEAGAGTTTAAVVALGGDEGDAYAYVEGQLNSLTIPTSVTSIVPISTSIGDQSRISNIVFAEGSALDIPEDAFQNVDGLTSITLPIGSIGANAFGNEGQYVGLTSLTSVTWPSGTGDVTLGEGAFQGCTGLTSITLPNNLTAIGASAFKDSGLTSITIPNNVTTIGASAFEGVSLSGGVTLGSGVETIGTDAFKGCLFTSINMPASLNTYYTNPTGNTTETGKTAFSDCDALTTITWPETGSLTAVGGFWDCPNLASDTLQNLPMWITAIDDYAFESIGNSSWATVAIPNHIATIGASAFGGRYIQSISIPGSVTRIGAGAFQCASEQRLTSLTFAENGSPLRIEEDAFNGALSISTTGPRREIVLPARVSYIGSRAFSEPQWTNFRIYNKNIKFQKNDDVIADPWNSKGYWSTIYYPRDAAANSDIMKLKAQLAGVGNTPDFEPFDVIPTHSITGTVPADATVTLFVAGEDFEPLLTSSGETATFTMAGVEEGALVYAVVSLAGYEDYIVYPAMDAQGKPTSVVMPKNDLELTVAKAKMTPLSNTGTLFVLADGAYKKDSRVAVFATDGKLVTQGKVARIGLFTADLLPPGTYNVAVWQANDYFTRVSSAADFEKMGLTAGTDYAWRAGTDAVTITTGQATTVEVDVPQMNTDRIASLLKSSDVWVSNSITPPGVTFNARISYEMAGSNNADSITVSIPEGLTVQQVYSATHSYADEYVFDATTRTLTVNLADGDKASGRLWLGLQAAPSDAPYTISAQVSTGAAKVPLGSTNVEAPAIQLSVPKGSLSGRTFDVTVFTAPEANVTFAINGTAANTTCTTNKVGRGTATLTIPEAALSINPHYSVTASVTIDGRDYNTYEAVEYSYLGGVSPNVYEFYFTHSGGTVYLAQNGKNLSGGYYFVLANPDENPGAFKPTWDYTAVFESAIPMIDTCELRLGMLDGSWVNCTMSLVKTESSPVKGAKRYTYKCSVKQKNAYLAADEIPYQFDLIPGTSSDVDQTVKSLEPSLFENFGDRVAEKHAEMKREAEQRHQGTPHAFVSSIPESITYKNLDEQWVEWLKTLSPDLQKKMASSMGVFGYAYKHEVWDPNGTWFNTLSPENQAKVNAAEADFDKAFELLAAATGDKKPLPAYASYEEYMEDNYGFEDGRKTGTVYDKEQLRAEGYTIIENTDTAKAKQAWASYYYTWGDDDSEGPLSAPTWIAVKIDDGSDSHSGLSTQDSGPGSGADEQATISVKDSNNNGITKTYSHTTGAIQDKAVGSVGDAVGMVDAAATALDNGVVSANSLGIGAQGAGVINSAGKVTSIVGPFIACYQTYRSTESKKQTVREYKERKGELDRINQQIKFYDEHRNPDGSKTKCQIELEKEKELLEILVKELYWADWISLADVGVNTLYGVVGSLAAILVASGVGAPEGAIVGICAGAGGLCWSAVATAANMVLAPTTDIYTMRVEQQRVIRTKQCIEEEDEALKLFADRHYHHFMKNTLIDPSGWVFEGTEDNRLAGVKATIYEMVGDNWVEWNAKEYDQENNQITGDGGLFAWNVLQGVWKVVFSKEGYQSAIVDIGNGYKRTNVAETPGLPVPPEWTDIHVGLISLAAPTAKIALDGNYIVVTFSQYMKTADAKKPAVTVNGSKVSTTWDSPKQGLNETGGPELMSTSLRMKVPATAKSGDILHVALSGGSNYAGTALVAASQDIKIPGQISIAGAKVTTNPARYTYDGKAKEPAVTVTLNGKQLTRNTDYTVRFENNKAVGTAKVIVTGKGDYKDTATGTFTISPIPISNAKVTTSPSSFTYNGKPQIPLSVTVTLNGKALVQNTDFTVAYSNNVNVGTATVTVTGKGNYAGTAKGSFTINAAPTPEPTPTPEPAGFTRLFGDIALDTMAAIVNVGWPGKTDVVVLTTVDGYWDALTAAGIAGMKGAPVLMTDGAALSAQTRSRIESLRPSTVVVCGGTAAVSDGVAQDACSAAGGARLVRCAGETATGTAADVYRKATSEGLGAWSAQAFVCTNDGYWDALAAAPISYANGMPIFLTEGAYGISDETLSTMRDGGVRSVYIVGGPAAVDGSVADRIASAGIEVAGRLSGDTAIETSEAVAGFGLAHNMTCTKMGVATTNGYWDALAGAPLCGLNNSVLVLAGDSSSHSISGFVGTHKSQIGGAYVFGGEAAVDPATFDALQAAVK